MRGEETILDRTPAAESLQLQFDLDLLRNERVRATLLAGFFGVLTAFLAGRLLLGLLNPLDADATPEQIWVPLGISGLLFGFEMLYRRFITQRIEASDPIPNAIWYLATCLEFGALIAAFYFSQQFSVSPALPGLPSQVAILLFFVMLSALRLHFFITAFTGLLAGICYLISIYVVRILANVFAEPFPEGYFWVAGLIFGGGILAGFVAMQIRRQAMARLRDVRERQRLEREVVQIAEDEQRRIGRDLHDGLGSHLTGISMLCRGLARRVNKGQTIQQKEMEDVAEMVEDAVSQARLLSRGLNPVKLDAEGLPGALRDLSINTQTVMGIACSFLTEDSIPVQDLDVATHLYRIAQEAVNNAVKHARPSHINIGWTVEAAQRVLSVQDDGIGLPAVISSDGLGLRSMNYRAQLIGATLDIQDRPDGGTTIRCTMPGLLKVAPR